MTSSPHASGARTSVSAPTASGTLDLDAGLRALGYDGFRPWQREAVTTLLEARRLLLVAPTGGGKSLVYQLPGVLLPGTTLVVSPLIALMQDQVAALEARGVPASFLASTLGPEENQRRMREAERGAFRLLYVAPERVFSGGFQRLLERLKVPLLAIDEAHCISEWGHDFRPEYLELARLVERLAQARVLACTATATPVVRDEIVSRLGLGTRTPQMVHGFARPNLVLRAAEVEGRKQRDRAVDALLQEALGSPGPGDGAAILYAATRRSAEQEAERLARAGWPAGVYHAGLESGQRERVQSDFSARALRVVVATNAFGMGIDRSDVRGVAHLAPPGSVEAYYQEVGRAGRDGDRAWGLLLWAPNDLPLRRRLIEHSQTGESVDPTIVEHKWNLFLELLRWAEGGTCRHDAILRYFGDDDEILQGCGQCDVCTHLIASDESDQATVTTVVRKALSGVARVHGRFGLALAAKLLAGVPDERLERSGLLDVRTFGVLRERPEAWLGRLLRRLVTAGWVGFSGGEHPVVVLTREGRAVMEGKLPARLLLPPPTTRAATAAPQPPARARGATGPAASAELGSDALLIFEALREHRREVAREAKVPPYVVASDRTLRDLAVLRPRTAEELQLVHGIGPGKAERFGAGFLEILRSHA